MHPIRPLGIEFTRPASLRIIWDLGLGSGFGTWNWDRVVVTRGHNHGPGFLHHFPSLTFVSRVLLSPRSRLLRVSLSSIVSPSIALWDAAVTFIEFIGSSVLGDRIIWFFNLYSPLSAIFHVVLLWSCGPTSLYPRIEWNSGPIIILSSGVELLCPDDQSRLAAFE